MSNMVNTVLGSIKVENLGRTLMHEHLIFGYPGFAGDATLSNSKEILYHRALKAAKEAKERGIDTIVDATPNECGRSPEILKKISENAEINIICATGYYCEALGSPSYFNFRKNLGYDVMAEICEMMMAEIETGINGAGVKPGIIKLASSNGQITGYEEMFFKAAARVQKQTGIVIVTHTEEGTMGPQQAELLLSEGGIKNKIAIGHMCGNRDIDYHIAVLKQGVYDAFDRFGEENFFGSPTDKERIMLIQSLKKEGFLNKILMSHDSVNAFWGRDVEFKGDFEPENSIVMTKIPDDINPMMIEMGMLQSDIDMIQIDNVKEIFK